MDLMLRSLSIKVSEFNLDFEFSLRILAINFVQYFSPVAVLIIFKFRHHFLFGRHDDYNHLYVGIIL